MPLGQGSCPVAEWHDRDVTVSFSTNHCGRSNLDRRKVRVSGVSLVGQQRENSLLVTDLKISPRDAKAAKGGPYGLQSINAEHVVWLQPAQG